MPKKRTSISFFIEWTTFQPCCSTMRLHHRMNCVNHWSSTQPIYSRASLFTASEPWGIEMATGSNFSVAVIESSGIRLIILVSLFRIPRFGFAAHQLNTTFRGWLNRSKSMPSQRYQTSVVEVRASTMSEYKNHAIFNTIWGRRNVQWFHLLLVPATIQSQAKRQLVSAIGRYCYVLFCF